MDLQDQHIAPASRIRLRDGRELTIRLLDASDGAAMVRFYAAIPFEDGIYYLPPSMRTPDAAILRSELADSPYEVCLVLADDDGEIHGEAWYRWSAENLERSLFGIGIRRTVQGVGAGRLIMRRLLEIGDKYGPSTMELTVQIENERAFKLYDSLGFKVIRNQMRDAREDSQPMPEYFMEREMSRRDRPIGAE